MWLKPRDSYERAATYALGYTNNKECHSYKILRHFPFTTRMEIYEFCSNLWRVLDDPNCTIHSNSVSLKGHIYWLASHEERQLNGLDDILLRLDFSSERFRFLPSPTQNFHVGHKSLAVVREEQLSALYYSYYGRELRIWVSTKIETTNVSWSNFLKVSLLDIPCLDKYYANFYIDHDKRVVVCSNSYGCLTTNFIHIIGKEEPIFRKISFSESPLIQAVSYFSLCSEFGSIP